ncbi:MAG: hypothetical protein Q8P30_00115 [Candidatus Uhrbacteria bacterium]|nr:hypothetical protein [Candidatus Uhrbacteria bacterium]
MKRRALLICFLSAAMLLPAFSVSAEEERCTCYCESSSGATSLGFASSRDACRDSCDSGEYTPFLGCYTADEEDLIPRNNTLCWTQAECEADMTILNGVEVPSIWGGQENRCDSGEGYCKNQPGNISLSVAIGNMTEVGDIGSYVNAVYIFLIPAAALIAIIMVMIGGLQYMLARGNPGAIGKAKERMSHAVVGLLLLLVAYTIAAVVDPNLVSFDSLSPPKVRQVVFLDTETTCEALSASGIDITMNAGGTGTCGDTGVLGDIPDGVIISMEKGDTCYYSTCSSVVETCATTGANTLDCIRCASSFDLLVGFNPGGLDPSESNCARLAHKTTDDDIAKKESFYCGFFNPANISTSITENNYERCIEVVYPKSSDSLKCQNLEADYGASCRSYDEAQGKYNFLSDSALGYNDDEVDDLRDHNNEYPFLETVCSADPCGFAPPGKSCEVFQGDLYQREYGFAPDCKFFDIPIPGCLATFAYFSQTGCFDTGFIQDMTYNGSLVKQLVDFAVSIGFTDVRELGFDTLSQAESRVKTTIRLWKSPIKCLDSEGNTLKDSLGISTCKNW